MPGLVEDAVRPLTYFDQQSLFDSPFGVDRNYWKGHFVRELPDELIDELLERMVALGKPPGGVLIESLHGAPKDADPGSGAAGFRRAAFNISAMASLAGPGARRGVHRVGAGHGGGDRALVVQRRRLRQLHAGGRADRAGARSVRS